MTGRGTTPTCPACGFALSRLHEVEWWCERCPWDGCPLHPTRWDCGCKPLTGQMMTPERQGVTWRDPLDWWFLSSGAALRLWCSLWAGIAAAQAEWRSWRG